MKRKVSVIALLALSALLYACGSKNPAETKAQPDTSVSEPADCCGGDIPDCCKEESKAECCKEDSETDCCHNESKEDCCKEESEADCCKQNQS